MCKDCGCQEGNERKYFHTHAHGEHSHSHDHSHEHGEHSHDHTHDHDHDHGEHSHSHDHDHSHDHGHTHDHEHNHSEEQHRTIALEQNILAKNDMFAHKNKHWLKDRGIVTLNFISSPGSGKTTLLSETLQLLKGRANCSVIVGDQSTDNDARRLKEKCDRVYQIETGSSCHINAEQVSEILPEVADETTDILFIENVGNLICPAAFELGEDFKIALISTTEGEDKPVKYPVIFSDAKVAVMTKTDLIPHLDWDIKECRKHIREVNPGMFIFELSAKTGEGMDRWVDYLESLIPAK